MYCNYAGQLFLGILNMSEEQISNLIFCQFSFKIQRKGISTT